MSRARWKSISFVSFDQPPRSFRQSFAPLTGPSLPQAVLPHSSSPGWGGSLIQLWSLTSPSILQTVLRSLNPSFPSPGSLCGNGSPSLHQVGVYSLRKSSLQWKSTLSGSQGCGGSLFQLWILTTPSFLQADLYSSDHSFAPWGSPSLLQAV